MNHLKLHLVSIEWGFVFYKLEHDYQDNIWFGVKAKGKLSLKTLKLSKSFCEIAATRAWCHPLYSKYIHCASIGLNVVRDQFVPMAACHCKLNRWHLAICRHPAKDQYPS